MDGKTLTEISIGNKMYIITSECSPSAIETLEEKLEKLILRHVSDAKSYQSTGEIQLDKCENQSEHSADTILGRDWYGAHQAS